MTVTIPVSEFRRLVTLVSPFAGKDALLPVYTMVRFDTRNRHLLVTATDRYRVIVAKTGCAGDFHATLPLTACKRIAATFKPDRRTHPHINLSVQYDGKVQVSLDGTIAGVAAAGMTIPQHDGEYPAIKVQQVVAYALARSTAEPATLNTGFLRDVPAEHQVGATVKTVGTGPTLLIGHDWIVAQQSMRLDGHDDREDTWRTLLATDAEENAA